MESKLVSSNLIEGTVYKQNLLMNHIVNLEEYDTSYDIQSMELMTELIKPFILFKKTKKGSINIYRKVDNLALQTLSPKFPLTGRTRYPEDSSIEMIKLNEYLYFIQCVFPRVIQYEINKNKKEQTYEGFKQDIIENKRNVKPRFRLPLFMDVGDFKDQCIIIVEKLNQCNEEEYIVTKEQNKKRLDELSERIEYLGKVSRINKEKNGTIDNAIHSLEILNYMEIEYTND